MKNQLLPPTGLLFSSLAVLSLSVMAADSKKPEKESGKAADNSVKNERDKEGETKTPLDQSNKPEDLKLTQEIRKAVMADDGLSMNGKNVKIITADGKVTLRGPVASAEEKKKIAAHAKHSAGKVPVVNQLEVTDSGKKK